MAQTPDQAFIQMLDSLNNRDEFEQSAALAQRELSKPNLNLDFKASLQYYVGYAFRFSNPGVAEPYLKKSLINARHVGNSKLIFDNLESLNELYCNLPEKEKERDKIAEQLRAMLDTAQTPKMLNRLNTAMSSYYGVLGYHEMQLQCDIKALDAMIQENRDRNLNGNDSANRLIAYMRVASSYLEIKQYPKAVEYLLLGRPNAPVRQPSLFTFYFRDAAIAYLGIGEVKTAELYADSLLALQSLPNVIPGDVRDNYNAIKLTLADHYLGIGKQDSAQFFLAGILPIKDTSQVNPYVINALNLALGKLKMQQGHYAEALQNFGRSEAMFQSMNKEDYVQILRLIAECYTGIGNLKMAVSYYQKYVPLRDTLYLQASKQSIASAEAKFQNKEKQIRIAAQSLQLADVRKQRLLMIVGLVLLGLAFVLLLVIYRNKKKNAEILAVKNRALDEANSTKAKLFSVIGHDLRSPINQVYQFLKLQQQHPTLIDEKEKELLSAKIQSATGTLLETMEDLLLWSKTQMASFSASVQTVPLLPVVQQCKALLQLNIDAKQLSVNVAVTPDVKVQTDAYFLQIILRNLLQNALKAAPNNTSVDVVFSGNCLKIINTGISFKQQDYLNALSDNTTSLSGMGLKLVDELCRKVALRLDFEEREEERTVAILRFS
ncbi:MAG: HAMP domain-containing histidine kinase [Bacteroidetes bacterium]|nr:HAMP domain-containing histidine kinase [Bacteroidota bacterium]